MYARILDNTSKLKIENVFALVLSFLSLLIFYKLFPVMITITIIVGISLMFLKKDKRKVKN